MKNFVSMNGVRLEVSVLQGPLGSVPRASKSEYSSLMDGSRQSSNPPNLAALSFAGSAWAWAQGQLVAPGERAIAIGVRAALPGQAGDVVANRQAIGAERVAGRMGLELGVLAVERLARFWRGDFVAVVVALRLAGSDDGVRLGSAEADA